MQGHLQEIDLQSILQIIEAGQRTGELWIEADSRSRPKNQWAGQNEGFVGQAVSQVTSQAVTPQETPASFSQSSSQPSFSQPSFSQPSNPCPAWAMYFWNGRIVYAGSRDDRHQPLQDHLQRLRLSPKLRSGQPAIAPDPHSILSPYQQMVWLFEQGHLSLAQVQSIVQAVVQEVLFDTLSLYQGIFRFSGCPSLVPLVLMPEIQAWIPKLSQPIQTWLRFHPLLHSPDQCLDLQDLMRLQDKLFPELSLDLISLSLLPSSSLQPSSPQSSSPQSSSPQSASLPSSALPSSSQSPSLPSSSPQPCLPIRRLARYLEWDLGKVGQRLYPYLETGAIRLKSPDLGISPSPDPGSASPALDLTLARDRVVCIDDCPTSRNLIEENLKSQGYEVISLSNSFKTLGLLFHLKPNLIFCDITLPELDSYQFCAMLRQVRLFHHVAIILLTEHPQTIDWIQYRQVGMSDYLVKPFTPEELAMRVSQGESRFKH